MKRSTACLTMLASICYPPVRLIYFFLSCLVFVLLFGFLHNSVRRSVAWSVFASASSRAQTLAGISANASIHAAGRGAPYVNFGDGHDVLTSYSASGAVGAQASLPADSKEVQTSGSPLATASADFDEDGVPDLISGYSTGGAGMVVLHRGNIDSIYPNAPEAQQRKASGSSSDSPFLSPARVFDLPQAADFAGAGDFDADGHWDVVTASRADNALYLLAGDGRGGFSEARRIELPGRVTALTSGEINRADGLTDIVVGITSGDGAKALVFEGPEGALRAEPETFSLAAEAASFALGRLDDDYTMDLAIADGSELTVVFGRDRKPSLDAAQQKEVPKAGVGRRVFPFGMRSVAIGDFRGDHKTRLSLLTDQGSVHLLTPAPPKKPKKKKKAVSLDSWKDETLATGNWQRATRMITARVSSAPCDDLVILDSANRKLHIVASNAAGAGQQAASFQPVSFDVDSEPMAVMPMRLNSDALSDLVVLRNGQVGPTALVTQAATVFVVDNIADDGLGTLRDAITQANANAGLDTINFALGAGPQTIAPLSPLPIITDAVVIDGTTQPGFAGSPLIELDGVNAEDSNGLFITSGNSVVRGLVISAFGDETNPNFSKLILLEVSDNNLVEGNFLGIDITGTVAVAGRTGVIAFAGSSNNTIGGTVAAARNVIAGTFFHAINLLQGTGGNVVRGNFIGTDVTGTVALPNANGVGAGIAIQGISNNSVGGTTAGAGNVISGGRSGGVIVTGASNLIQGNFIGTNSSGNAALGNASSGVSISSAAANTIGPGNVISGNGLGVSINNAGATGNQVQGNFIGTDLTGSVALGNGGSGVFIFNASGNTVGGVAAAARNIISGSTGSTGISIVGISATGNQVRGNFIGTDLSGTSALGNASHGVSLSGSSNGIVSGNLISGNGNSIGFGGVVIVGTASVGPGTGNIIQGNLIGTDVSGTAALGNHSFGVALAAPNNFLGGTSAAARNVISGNGNEPGFSAVFITGTSGGATGSGSVVQGNFIGTAADGISPLGNVGEGFGIAVIPGFVFSNVTLGGIASGAGNVIAFNSENGAVVLSGTGHSILSNSIFSNGRLGIELSGAFSPLDGPTPNDPCDADAGPNTLQNSPVLTAVFPSGSRVGIQGTLNSTANSTFTIQFFANSGCDPSGFGEGERFIGSTEVTTDQTCNASFSFLANDAPSGQSITATATDANGNTSEFSNCIPIGTGAVNLFVTKTVSPTAARPGDKVTYTITLTNKGPAIATNVALTDNLPPQVTFVSCKGACGGSGNNRSFSSALLSVNASLTVTIEATVNPSVANGTIINNTASVTASVAGVATTASATAPFTVSTQAPAITCPANVLAASGQGQTTAIVSYPAPTLAGNPSNVAVICVPPAGSAFPIGTTTVNCTATDPAGNKSSCSFSVTVNQGNPSLDKTAVDFGNPIALPNQNPPTETFTITNASAASVDLTLASIRRTGSDAGARITNPDDSGFFTVFAVNPGGADTQLNPGSTTPIPPGQRTFRVMFNPSVPPVASGTSNLSASQVLPDAVTSSVIFNVSGGGSLTVNLTGRVATGVRLIDPANPTRSPVVSFNRSGNQFNLTYSVFDSNLDVSRASYQFLDSGGQPTGQPVEVNLAQALQAVNLLRGQSFTVEQPFSGASSHPEIAGVRVTVFDGETSAVGTASQGSSAASNTPAGDVLRMKVLLPRVRIRRLAP